jgi:hypothetical protein
VGLAMGIIFILIISAAFIGCCAMWVSGIHHMNKNFPDYKAEDFLNEEEDDPKN